MIIKITKLNGHIFDKIPHKQLVFPSETHNLFIELYRYKRDFTFKGEFEERKKFTKTKSWLLLRLILANKLLNDWRRAGHCICCFKFLMRTAREIERESWFVFKI